MYNSDTFSICRPVRLANTKFFFSDRCGLFEKQSSFYFQAKSHANLIKDNIFVRPLFPLPHFARRLTCARFGSSTGPEQG